MSEELKTIQETAKATQEVAKTTGKAIDAAEKLGKFVSKYIAGSLEQGMGIVHDKLMYMRWERQQRYMARAQLFLKQLGLEEPSRAVPMQLLIPMLQGASLEENDELQDRWAKLLVNAADAESRVVVTRNYITILEHLTPYDARVLDKIYSVPEQEFARGFWVCGVVNEFYPDPSNIDAKNPPAELRLALESLMQLGVITGNPGYSGNPTFLIYQNMLGRSFVNACKLRDEKQAI